MKLYIGVFVLASAAFGQVEHQKNHHPSSAEFAKILEDPARDKWQKPHEVVMALDLKIGRASCRERV